MSISTTAVGKRASERFMLVRLTPGRYVSDDLASAGGGVYTMTFNYPIARVERNGTTLTETTTNPPGTNDYWYHDETTGSFKIKLASAPSSSNAIVIFYYLFYTGHRPRTAYESPQDSATPERNWEPRILRYPRVRQSFSNLISGLLSFESSNLEIDNSDYSFQDYLTANDSFSQTLVDIWACVDSTSDIRKIYTGTVQRLAVTKNRVTLDLNDPLRNLDRTADLNIGPGYFSFPITSGRYPGHGGKPWYVPMGQVSPYTTKARDVASSPVVLHDLVDGLAMYDVDYSEDISLTTNTQWQGGPTVFNLRTQSYGTIINTVTNGSYRYVRFSDLEHVDIGHTVRWTEASVTYYAIVLSVEAFTYLGDVYNCVLDTTDPMTGSSTMTTTTPAVAVGVKNYPSTGDVTILKQGLDFSSVSQSGSPISSTRGTNHFTIYPNLLFNANLTSIAFDPKVHEVFYKVYQSVNADFNHGTILKLLLKCAGLTTNDTSFDDANTALPITTQFMIPNIDESTPSTYAKYVEDILNSTLGYLRVNESGEIVYELLAAPSSTDTRDKYTILNDSISIDVDYQDVVTDVVFQNPHLPQGAAKSADPTETATFELYLHKIRKTYYHRHCLELDSGDYVKSTEVAAIRMGKQTRYRWSTATEDLNVSLGEDLVLEHDAVPGGSVTVKVTSIEVGGNSVSIEAVDLENL